MWVAADNGSGLSWLQAVSLQLAYDAVRQQRPDCKIVQTYLHAKPDLAGSFDLNCKPHGRVVVYVDFQ
jgi:hypothetical protein